jgi:hypothetical protein
MADLFAPTAVERLRADLAHLSAASTTARLPAVGHLAEALRLLLTDPAVAAALTRTENPGLRTEDLSDAPQSSVLSPEHSDDPAWDELAPGPQTDADRDTIFVLLGQLYWPTQRIVNVLHKHCGVETDGVPLPDVIGAIATLDGRQSRALRTYLERHWATAQRAALAEAG